MIAKTSRKNIVVEKTSFILKLGHDLNQEGMEIS